ncbi:hypothetical protein Emag_000364 [Eimeria magna]
MPRFWPRRQAGGRRASDSAQAADDNEPEASADGPPEVRPSPDGLMNAVDHKASSQAPYKVGLLSPIDESPFEGQGALTPSLASALFTSNAKLINRPSAVLRAGGPEARDSGPPERGQSPPGIHKNRTLRLLELPVYGESFRAPSSRGLEESNSLAVAPKTPLLSPISRGSLPRIPAVPRSLLFSDEDVNLEKAESGEPPGAPADRRERRVKSALKDLPRRLRSVLVQTWGGTVYGMFSEGRAFENSMTGFPPSFLDSRMEAQFMCVHSKRVTFYYVALTCFWIIFMTIVFGSFISRVKKFRVIWVLPYIVGMSTALILTVAYLALVGVVVLRMRPLKRKHQQAAQQEGNANTAVGEGAAEGAHQDDVSAKAAVEWRESAKLRVYHLRWVILRDVIISVILVLVSSYQRNSLNLTT